MNEYQSLLCEEGYFQRHSLLPTAIREEILACIETVRDAGFPVTFSLIYYVVYEAFRYFDPILCHLLGNDHQLIPNFWVYYVETRDDRKGVEPHRDTEYFRTIRTDGNPNVLTLLDRCDRRNSLRFRFIRRSSQPSPGIRRRDLQTPASRE